MDKKDKSGAATQASIPAGYALVPIQPTSAMIRAAENSEGRSTSRNMEAPSLIYRDMLAAAPSPVAALPSQAEPVVAGQQVAPVGYARESELAKLEDNRIAGIGMMIHKEPAEGRAALYLAAPSSLPMAADARDQVLEDRKFVLLKAARELLHKQTESSYVLNLLMETVFYDDADCDGHCLMEDIGYLFDELDEKGQRPASQEAEIRAAAVKPPLFDKDPSNTQY